MLSSRVKISCFRAKAHLVFHWYLYNKKLHLPRNNCCNLSTGTHTSIRLIEIPFHDTQKVIYSFIFFVFLGRGYYLFNGALIKPGWVLTVANVLPGASKLQVVLGKPCVSIHHHPRQRK